MQSDPARAKRVLILEYQLPLGCCVHMTPVFEALKRCRPEIEIAVATLGLGCEVLRYSPFVDHLIETSNPYDDLRGAVGRLRSELRRLQFKPECVLTGASDQRTKIALMGLLGSSGWRGGYTVQDALYHHPLVYDKAISLIDRNLKLARLLGCEPDAFEPRLFFSRRDADAAKVLLESANPTRLPLVAMVTQNSGGQRTGWRKEHFAQVIRHTSERLGSAVIYVGTAVDGEAIEEIRASAGGVGVSLAGKTSVAVLAAVLSRCDAMVSLDTGTMHVGRAVKTPMVVLGPSWQKPIEWLPLASANARVLRGADRETVPEDYRLDEISPEVVIAALDDLFATYRPSEADRESRTESSLSSVDHLPSRG
ncbi:glycosyltransferase family 9 protein [Granulicella sp. S190]|uniref:glycosyltransferase family 9 protein n=1 Tax=Granulicella sp. S190 TaxID=1747226 RepID=UPI00131BA6A7|nr:glycosyltransferase family 9 protein [Granulicella sp. S190]